MKESNLNTTISKAFSSKGFGFKIPDPPGSFNGVQLPFDGFAVLKNKHIYWEAKLLKNKIQSFAFSKIEDHQYIYLNQIKNLSPKSITIYPVGIFIPRKLYYIFNFDSELIKFLKEECMKKSVLKKEFETLIDMQMYTIIVRDKVTGAYEVDPTILLDKIVTLSFWKDTFKNEICKKIDKKRDAEINA